MRHIRVYTALSLFLLIGLLIRRVSLPLERELQTEGILEEAPVQPPESGIGQNHEKKNADITIQETDQPLLTGKIALPESYDYRKEGRAPLVKNQGTLGTCWAFASLMALETTLLPDEALDFSEDHMSLNNGFCLTQDDGGEYTMSMAYLLSWRGPVLEKDDPYGDSYSPSGLSPAKHVQEIQILPEKDYEMIKEAVYLYGGVQSSLYTSMKDFKSRSVYYNQDNHAYCYLGTEKPNHDSVIIGWDDNYPKENFNVEVEGDGAFICVNSWGDEFGELGYFYVSYYDSNIGVQNILYSRVESPDNYDHIYQSDLRGWVGQLGYGEETAYFANVYQADGQESLEAVGFYATGPDSVYEVYVAREIGEKPDFNTKYLIAHGSFVQTGYYTVPLDQQIKLKEGERFAVIVKIKTPGAIHPVAIEYDAGDGRTQVNLNDGEGYISLDGKAWERAEEEQNSNICLKAYTKDR